MEKNANQKTFRIGYVLTLAFALVSYCIGASSGTGQLAMQLYTAYGLEGLAGIVLEYGVLGAFTVFVVYICRKNNLTTAADCYNWLMGKWAGKVIYYYTIVYLFCVMIQLFSGTGGIVNQYYGVPAWIGSAVMAALCIASVLFGFKKLLTIIGRIAPAIMVVVLLSALVSLINPVDGFAVGLAHVKEAQYQIGSTWHGASLLDFAYSIIFYIPYIVSVNNADENATVKESIGWSVIGYIMIAAFFAITVLSQIANYSIAAGATAPNLAIALEFVPALSVIFALMLLAAIFTSTAPLGVMVAEFCAEPGTKKNQIIGIVAVAVACFISLFLPYAAVVNVLTSVAGWIGVACLVIMAAYRLYVKFVKN